MAQRKLKVMNIEVETVGPTVVGGKRAAGDCTILTIWFSRKLTALEVSGVRAVLDSEIK